MNASESKIEQLEREIARLKEESRDYRIGMQVSQQKRKCTVIVVRISPNEWCEYIISAPTPHTEEELAKLVAPYLSRITIAALTDALTDRKSVV